MRNILLAVVGLSPQVVTETLYALHQERRRVHAIHLVTTREGADRVHATLLGGEHGQFRRYLQEYGIDPREIEFNDSTVHMVRGGFGNPVSDILDESDNEQLMELCLRLTFEFTSDPDTAVFFSVAGGRKTMSSCLALAAQLYGRPQDRMYHVLVPPEFESCRDFFYPPRKPRLLNLRGRDGEPFFKDTSYARINLVPLPFVSIRRWLAADYLTRPHDPATLMASLVRGKERILEVDIQECKLRYAGLEVDLTPVQMTLFAFFAVQKKRCSLEHDCRNCTDCYLSMEDIHATQDRISELYSQIRGSRPIEEMSDTGITSLSQENFLSYKSKIRQRLRKGFGNHLAEQLGIASTESRPARHGLVVDRRHLKVII